MLDVNLTSSVDVGLVDEGSSGEGVHVRIRNGIGILTKVGASRLSRKVVWLSLDLTSRVDVVFIAKQINRVGVETKAITDLSIQAKVELGLGLGGKSFVSGGDGPGLDVELSVCVKTDGRRRRRRERPCYPELR